MKKILIITCLCIMSLTASAQGLGGFLNGLFGGNSQSTNTSTDIGSAITGLVSGLLSSDNVNPETLVGHWVYNSPAVVFKSENYLQQAGGAAIAGVLEAKLAPYYKKTGINKLQMDINANREFVMKIGKLKLTGTIEKVNNDIYFVFTTLGNVPLCEVKTYINQAPGSLSIMFDVSRLKEVMTALSSASRSSTIQTVSSLLNSYDGICVGFKLHK